MGIEYDYDEHASEGVNRIMAMIGIVLIGCAGLVWAVFQPHDAQPSTPTVRAECAR